MNHVNEWRGLRDKKAKEAFDALTRHYGQGSATGWACLLTRAELLPVGANVDGLIILADVIRNVNKDTAAADAIMTFVQLAEYVWQLESEACPLPSHGQTTCAA